MRVGYREGIGRAGIIVASLSRRNNSLDARKRTRLSPLIRSGPEGPTQCHNLSNFVTKCHTSSQIVTAACRRQAIQIFHKELKPFTWAKQNLEHGMTSAAPPLCLTYKTNVTRTETNFEKAASSVSVIDDAGTVRRVFRYQDQHALRDEVSGTDPIPQSRSPTALRF
jgi:hypothetical protein